MTPRIPKSEECIAFEEHLAKCHQCSKEPTDEDAALCEEGFRLLQKAVAKQRWPGE